MRVATTRRCSFLTSLSIVCSRIAIFAIQIRSSHSLLLSTNGEAYKQEYALPATGLPPLPCGRSLKVKTMHDSGILGASIWPAAAPLCRHLLANYKDTLKEAHCIELGAGTGAVGLYAAGLGCFKSVILTDCRPQPDSSIPYTTNGSCSKLPADGSNVLLEILETNVKANCKLLHDDPPRVMELDWTKPHQLERVASQTTNGDGFDVILCSDVTHFTAMHQPLVTTIARLLRPSYGVCLLSHQERLLTLKGIDMQLEEFIRSATESGLKVEPMEVPASCDNGGPISLLRIQHGTSSTKLVL